MVQNVHVNPNKGCNRFPKYKARTTGCSVQFGFGSIILDFSLGPTSYDNDKMASKLKVLLE
jgi:hypothetical protein